MPTLTIEPVTRIEGHAKITLKQDSHGDIVDAHFHVTQVRGFEKFCEGRPFTEMPALMARICGICPVAYQMSAVHAIERAMGVTIDPAIRLLRRLFYCGEGIERPSLRATLHRVLAESRAARAHARWVGSGMWRASGAPPGARIQACSAHAPDRRCHRAQPHARYSFRFRAT